MSGEIKKGFPPFYAPDSEVLILGSFPSVKSRRVDFYYGNPQNRFWRVLAKFFAAPVPESTDEKKAFLLSHKIALWDIVTECEIVGSQDATIKNYEIADVRAFVEEVPVKAVLINGGTAFNIFEKNFSDIRVPYLRLPSTSPANTRFDEEEWFDGLRTVFSGT